MNAIDYVYGYDGAPVPGCGCDMCIKWQAPAEPVIMTEHEGVTLPFTEDFRKLLAATDKLRAKAASNLVRLV